MRPTRRGVAVLLVAVAATAVGSQFGQRGLAAIAAPLFVAVVGAAVQVALTGAPTIERSTARRGFVGEGDTVTLTVGGNGIARLTDQRPEGISGPATVTRALPATVRYDLSYDRRGDHRLGPVEVTLTDTLGLVRADTTVEATDEVLVYPAVSELGDATDVLQAIADDSEEHQSFDRLREYAPGDAMRDIHWKSSAKRGELFVAEFDDGANDRTLTLAARATEGHGDAMATAAATVAIEALGRGFGLELLTPGGTVTTGYGDRQRTRVLETLARTPSGECSRAETADILVSADDDGVTVTVADRQRAFEDLSTAPETAADGGQP